MAATNNWRAVEAEIERIISAEKESPFTSETIAQARDFLQAVRDRYPVPAVGKGYWSTIIFSWPTSPRGPLDIEIFADRIERYLCPDRATDIRYVPHVPGEPFPPDLLDELPAVEPPR
jgi:hypothetical protein